MREPEPRTARTGHPTRRDVPPDGEQTECSDKEEGVPLGGQRRTEQDSGDDAPRAESESGTEVGALEVIEPGGSAPTTVLTIEDERPERRQEEERQRQVEERRAAHHQMKPVDGEQEAGDRAEDRGAGHPAYEAGEQQNAQGAENRNGDPPPEGIHPEELLSCGDDPLAERRMDDVRRGVGEDVEIAAENPFIRLVDEVLLVAVVQQAVGILGVVRLIEDEDTRLAKLPEAQEAGQGGDGEGTHPACDPISRPRGKEPPSDTRAVRLDLRRLTDLRIDAAAGQVCVGEGHLCIVKPAETSLSAPHWGAGVRVVRVRRCRRDVGGRLTARPPPPQHPGGSVLMPRAPAPRRGARRQ